MPGLTSSRLIVAVTAVIIVYLGITAAGNALESRRLGGERRAMEREIARYRQEHDQLTGIRTYLQSDEYVQAIARRELGLVMPGEPAVIIVSPNRLPSPAGGRQEQRWWQRVFGP